MSFYRKYRPQIISEIDNITVRDKVISLLGKERRDLPHAYLFSGPRGTGKTTVARVIAKIFDCENLSKTNGPCGKCDQCITIANGTNIDVLEIDAASNRGIDEIRQLRDRIGLTPSSAKYTVYIIDEVHMLTSEAFNALLKTLEEPPVHAIFVLATTDPQKVPITIKSRCVQFVFNRAGKTEIAGALKRITQKENIDIQPDAVEALINVADGSFRDAVKLLEQVSFEKGKISAELVRKLLSIGDNQIVTNLIESVRLGQTTKALEIIETLMNTGTDIKSFMQQILYRLESDLILQVKTDSASVSSSDIPKMIRIFSQAYTDIRWSPIPQLPLELAVIELSSVKNNSWPTGKSIPKVAKNDLEVKLPDPVVMDSTGTDVGSGSITLEKLNDCWKDVIEELKPYNHSIAGVMRSTRPKEVSGGTVVIEAFYKFHLEKLSEPKTKDLLITTFKKLFGDKVKVNIVLGKK